MSAAEETWIALITLTPARRATSAQKEAHSSQFGYTIESCSSSTARVTSARVGLTKTPTTSSLRRKAAVISAATPGSTLRGEGSKWISPIAQAPSRTASAASSRLVIPQNLTRIRPDYGTQTATPPDACHPQGYKRREKKNRPRGRTPPGRRCASLSLAARLLRPAPGGSPASRSQFLVCHHGGTSASPVRRVSSCRRVRRSVPCW